MSNRHVQANIARSLMNISDSITKEYKEYVVDIDKKATILNGDEEAKIAHLYAVQSALTIMFTAINKETKRLAVVISDKS